MRETKRNTGVTLIVLIVTIIILIILAGVSINRIVGKKGLIKKGEEASNNTAVMKALEDAKMAYRDCYNEKEEDVEIGSTVTTADVANKMINKYRI